MLGPGARAAAAAFLVMAMLRQYTAGPASNTSNATSSNPAASGLRPDASRGMETITTTSHTATMPRISARRRIGLLGCFMLRKDVP